MGFKPFVTLASMRNDRKKSAVNNESGDDEDAIAASKSGNDGEVLSTLSSVKRKTLLGN